MFKGSRFKPVSSGDREVGIRLAYLRRLDGYKQETFAKELGITRAQLSNVESARVSLKLRLGWDACKLLDIHPDYLLHGVVPRPFPTAEDSPLLKRVEALVSANPNSGFFHGYAQIGWLLGPDAVPVINLEKPKNQGLTNITDIGNTRGVSLQDLLASLRVATAKRGMKTVLAKHMGVPLANVSQWLSGEREPGGETTLRLLKWVQEHEKK